MKKISATLFACLLCFVSCNKDELDTPEPDGVKKENEVKAITKGGRILRAGYGINPLTNESFDTAIDDVFDRVERTNNFPTGTKVAIEVVDTETAIEKVVSRELGFSIGFNNPEDKTPGKNGNPDAGGGGDNGGGEDGGGDSGGPDEEDIILFNAVKGNPTADSIPFPTFSDISFSISARKFMYERIATGSKRKSIIVRVTIPIRKDEVLRKRPRPSDDAKEDIQIGKFTFMDNYGPAWVSAETSAIEVFHVFNFDFSSFDSTEVEEREGSFSLGIQPYFGLSVNNSTTSFEKREIAETFIDQQVLTNLVGFAPKLFSTDDFSTIFQKRGYQKEIRRMIQFAKRSPFNLKPFKQTLRPHVDPRFDKTTQGPNNKFFRAEFKKLGKCATNLDRWTALEARLETVKKKSADANMRRRATTALRQVRVEIEKARNCRNSKPPTKSRYGSIRL